MSDRKDKPENYVSETSHDREVSLWRDMPSAEHFHGPQYTDLEKRVLRLKPGQMLGHNLRIYINGTGLSERTMKEKIEMYRAHIYFIFEGTSKN